MAFPFLLVTEIFHSLQGETSLAGVPFAFIRLTGCNLRCTYCDSSYSFKNGHRMRISEIIKTIRPFRTTHVLITGGEPLLQRQTLNLIETLNAQSYQVSIETHGEVSIQAATKLARIVMDIKTPSSQMNRGGFVSNLEFLKPTDEIKFVIASPEDYIWAKSIIQSQTLPRHCEVLMSTALPAQGSPGTFPGVTPTWLAERILEDRLRVRLQLQLHKILWGQDKKGV
jgi:7-carboxy-7-deazaguanine synthase